MNDEIITAIEWPKLGQLKEDINQFWKVLYKDMTEKYMSKYQREEVFNKIKRKVNILSLCLSWYLLALKIN